LIGKDAEANCCNSLILYCPSVSGGTGKNQEIASKAIAGVKMVLELTVFEMLLLNSLYLAYIQI